MVTKKAKSLQKPKFRYTLLLANGKETYIVGDELGFNGGEKEATIFLDNQEVAHYVRGTVVGWASSPFHDPKDNDEDEE